MAGRGESPQRERRRQDGDCSLGTSGLVGAVVRRDSPVRVSVENAAVMEEGVNPLRFTLSRTAPRVEHEALLCRFGGC